MRKTRTARRERGTAILETVLLYMFVITGTLMIGTRIQQAELQLMDNTFGAVCAALR